jgi:hypothetical protein
MRIYKDAFGTPCDLDDPETYNYLPNDDRSLDDRMFKNIGQALVYMDYFNKDHYKEDSPQRIRVNNLIKIFSDSRRDNWGNTLWFKEQCFLFEDETENMC